MNTSPAAPISLFAQRSLGKAQQAANEALVCLATGKRLTSARVDPAAMIAVTRMQADVMANLKEIEAMQRENARLSTEDGAASVMSEMLVELDGLAVQAANTGAMSDAEREALQIEADSVVQAIDHVARISGLSQSYSSSTLGSDEGLNAGSGANGDSLSDVTRGGSLNLVDGDIENAQRVIRNAISAVATRRGQIGLQVREHESMQRALSTEFESLSSAISKLADTDYAKETSALVRAKVLEQASIGAIMAGNQTRARVLDLLA